MGRRQKGCVQAVASQSRRRPVGRQAAGLAAWLDGAAAEQLACERLVAEGWTVLLRRARTPCGEIDIVAERPGGGLIAFVEVKIRPSLAAAATALRPAQVRRLVGAAQCLLAANTHWLAGELRFDLIVVDAAGRVRRISDAVRLDHDAEPATG